MVDFAGGHPSTEDAAEVIRALDDELGGDGISFHPGVQYRHIMVAPAELAEAECVPPHDLSDKAAVWPTGPAAGRLNDLMERSRAIVGGSGLAANQVWLWGQGAQPQLPSFREVHGVEAGLVTAVDLVRGLGVLTGMDVVEVEGATGWYDTNYEGKRDAALAGLAAGKDLFVIHVEATDEAGHAGDLAEKVAALEHWDDRILAGPRRWARRHGAVAAPAPARPPHAGGAEDPHHRLRAVPAGRLGDRRPGRRVLRARDRRLRTGARPRAHGASPRHHRPWLTEWLENRSRLPTFLPDRSLSTVVELLRGIALTAEVRRGGALRPDPLNAHASRH